MDLTEDSGSPGLARSMGSHFCDSVALQPGHIHRHNVLLLKELARVRQEVAWSLRLFESEGDGIRQSCNRSQV